MRTLTALALAAMLMATGARSEIITVCERASGRTAALEGGTVQWVDDGLSEGSITILRDANGAYDVSIKDAAGNFTAREDGASISADTEADLTLVVRYPLGTVETYILALASDGAGTLIWSAMKNRVVGVTKGSLFTASCRRP
jgi:hypothetical protein